MSIVAIISALAAVAAAWFARQQRQVADKALKAAEVSADAAKLSADTNAMLAAIEKDRHTEENRPTWIPRVEKTTTDAGTLWLRMALERGRVEAVAVELLNFTSFGFRQLDVDQADGVVDETHAQGGQVVQGRSIVWRVMLPIGPERMTCEPCFERADWIAKNDPTWFMRPGATKPEVPADSV